MVRETAKARTARLAGAEWGYQTMVRVPLHSTADTSLRGLGATRTRTMAWWVSPRSARGGLGRSPV